MTDDDCNSTYPRGIEIIVSALILNAKGEILLIKQQLKWGDVWTLPGGHLKVGEALADGARREGEEETGLSLRLAGLVKWGEIIDNKTLARPVHFIYFDYCFRAEDAQLRPDRSEVSETLWLKPQDALNLNISQAYRETIKYYNDVMKGSIPGSS